MTDVLVLDYPPGYAGPRPIEEQIREIAWRFNLSSREALDRVRCGLPPLPAGAEGWFAVPSEEAVTRRLFPSVVDPAERYRAVVGLAAQVLGIACEFSDHEARKLLSGLVQEELSARARSLVARDQNAEVLIVAAQLGRLHRGKAPGHIQYGLLEYGLGLFWVMSILLTHPNRLCDSVGLDLDCPGDFHLDHGDPRIVTVPTLSHTGSGIVCGTTCWPGLAVDRNGPATWFPLLDR